MRVAVTHIARITLLAFLLNVILPFLAVYNVPTADALAKQASSSFGEKVLICTLTGFKWVTWEDLQNGSEEHAPHPDYKCALCYLAAHGLKNFLTPDDTLWAYGVMAGNTGFSTYSYQPVALYLQSSRHTRAPPYSLIG